MPPSQPRAAMTGRLYLTPGVLTRVFLTTPDEIRSFRVLIYRNSGSPGYWLGDGMMPFRDDDAHSEEIWTGFLVSNEGHHPAERHPRENRPRDDGVESLSITVFNPDDPDNPSAPLSIVGVVIP